MAGVSRTEPRGKETGTAGPHLLIWAAAAGQRHQRHLLRLKAFSGIDQLQEAEPALVQACRIDRQPRWWLHTPAVLL